MSFEMKGCPQCGLEKSKWILGGYASDGTLYCCETCARGWGCICKEAIERRTASGRRNLESQGRRTELAASGNAELN